ncbi:DUF4902 domain-containing protein [Vibrio sp. SM6]|uniref:DUF4902 domain-containing protein n=1 Tax=Vibrio agarilyticus TaxID=2726741 RepID=A0A7X8TQW3_9VIBR|nr:DUF4902 domain-containing protein [Vibrio agarilyticus]NLS12976.1 DUF4902 domain-containing protein [Vibrio agarilyticus]
MQRFRSKKFTLLEMGLYDSDCQFSQESSSCDLSGFAEWQYGDTPSLSIGFDWEVRNGAIVLCGEPFCNFVLRTDSGLVMSHEATTLRLVSEIEHWGWQNTIKKNLYKSLH